MAGLFRYHGCFFLEGISNHCSIPQASVLCSRPRSYERSMKAMTPVTQMRDLRSSSPILPKGLKFPLRRGHKRYGLSHDSRGLTNGRCPRFDVGLEPEQFLLTANAAPLVIVIVGAAHDERGMTRLSQQVLGEPLALREETCRLINTGTYVSHAPRASCRRRREEHPILAVLFRIFVCA